MSVTSIPKISRLVPPRATHLLAQCHKLMSERLPGLLKVLLDKTDDTFFELANKADSSRRQQLYFDAMRELRLKRLPLEADLFRSLKDDFEACFTTVTPKACAQVNDEFGSEWTLVTADDVEESLAATNFIESIKSRCKQEMFALDQRVGHLLSDPLISGIGNPFGPDALGKALRAMSHRLEANIEARITLLKLSDRCLGPGLYELYRGLNEFLIREDVLPRVAPTFTRCGPPRARVIIETDEGATEATGQDVFSTLQQLMRPGLPDPVSGTGGMSGVSVSRGGMPGFAVADGGTADRLSGATQGFATQGSGAPLSTASFLTNLTDIQHGQVCGQFVNFDPALSQNGTVNVLRSLRDSGAIGLLNQTDNLTLDIVTLLFDYILDDPSIPDRIKALIGRLQIPLLKVALIDKELFSKKTHPARQLLDALAAAAIGWSEGSRQGDAFYEKIQYVVYRVVEEFDKDLGLFSQLLAELNAFLAEEERSSAQQAERAAKSLRTKERIVLAKLAVDEAVKTRLSGTEPREFVLQFVREYWRQQLIVTYVEQGPTSETWAQQLTVIDDLVWSVQRKTTPEEKRELTTRLPKLIKALKAGMQELDMAPAACSKFLTMLASVHVVSVKNVEEASLAERCLTHREAAEDVHAAPAPNEEAFVKQALDRLFARKTVEIGLEFDFAALEAEVAAEPEPESEVPVPQDEYLEQVMALDLGDWLEFTLPDATVVRSRFTWISPATGRYLFTDRQGRKAFDLPLSALHDQFRANKAVRVTALPDPLFERAIGELMERLERQVA